MRKSLTSQKFNPDEPSTVGVEFDKKCEIVVSKSCNWKTSLDDATHAEIFEKELSSTIASEARSRAIRSLANEDGSVRDECQEPASVPERLEHKVSDAETVEEISPVLPTKKDHLLRHQTKPEAKREILGPGDDLSNEKSSDEQTFKAELLDQGSSAGAAVSERTAICDHDGVFLVNEMSLPLRENLSRPTQSLSEKEFNEDSEGEEKEEEDASLHSDPYDVMPESVKERVQALIDDNVRHSSVRRETYIDMLDYGGQDVFYATHYLYLSKEAIYLAVFDASVPLDSQSSSYFRAPGSEPVKIDEFPGKTYYDRLEEWISAVYLMEPPDNRKVFYDRGNRCETPSVLIVGTHKDKAELVPGLLERQNKYLEERLKGKSFWKHVVEASENRVFFAIDNTKSDPQAPTSEDRDVQLLRLKAEEIAKDLSGVRKVPLKFLRFERFVRKMKAASPRKTTTIKSLRTVASVVASISDEEFPLAIRFLCNRAVILYHDIPGPKTVNDTVLDPSWLARVMQNIITVPSRQSLPSSLRNDVERSKSKGILTKEFVDYQLKTVESKDLVLKLMQYFDLLCDYYRFELHSGSGDDRKHLIDPDGPERDDLVVDNSSLPKLAYFIPCLLREQGELESLVTSPECRTFPLYLYSKDARVPPPLFYRLLTRLSRLFPRLPRLHRNVGYFHVYYWHTLEISLFQYFFRICVFVADGGRLHRAVCSRIRNLVCKEINEMKMQGMASLQLCLGYFYNSHASCLPQKCEEDTFVSLEGFPHRTGQLFAGESEVTPPSNLAVWYENSSFRVNRVIFQ